jgi:nucleotide-binding universal stress UspA family protein
MRVLVATDGSSQGQAAVEEVARRPWPEGTTVEVVTVIHVAAPFAPDPAFVMAFVYLDHLEKVRKRAPEIVADAAARLRAAGLAVETQVLEGTPKTQIIEEAERTGADLVVVGSHGYGAARRFVLGSVATAVALHAPCSVEIVRTRAAA